MTKRYPLDPFRAPQPSADFKARVLQAAERAPRTVAPASPPRRVFGPWDWALAAAAALMILANVLLGQAVPKRLPREMADQPAQVQDTDLAAMGITEKMLNLPPSRTRRGGIQGGNPEVARL